jgi:hypothetical protein
MGCTRVFAILEELGQQAVAALFCYTDLLHLDPIASHTSQKRFAVLLKKILIELFVQI